MSLDVWMIIQDFVLIFIVAIGVGVLATFFFDKVVICGGPSKRIKNIEVNEYEEL